MSVRRLIVEVDLDGLNVTRFCKQHGISTWFFYELRRRHGRGESIEPRSRAPRRVANRTPSDVEDLIVGLRKELHDAGLDAGPASIWWHLQQRTGSGPSESTIWRILKARGLIVAEPAKAPKHAGRRFVAERANECWQLDDTHWDLIDGTEVKILNILDDHSRLAVAVGRVRQCRRHRHPGCVRERGCDHRMAGTVLVRQRGRVSGSCSRKRSPRSACAPALAPVSPTNERQSRTVPPHGQALARTPTARRDHHRAPNPTRRVPSRLQP